MQINSEQIVIWQARADNVLSTIQGYLAPYDPLLDRWVSPYATLPDMPEGMLTALSILASLITLIVLATVFDMFGTLLLRVTFGYQARRPFHPGMWVLFDKITAQLSPKYRLLPWVTLYDLLDFINGSKRQCNKHQQQLMAVHVDAVICDATTGWPVQVVMLAPHSRQSRAAKRRYSRINKACKRAGLAITTVSNDTTSPESLEIRLKRFLVDHAVVKQEEL